MSAALGLLRLQQVDNRIGRNETRLQQIQELLENNAELAAAREVLTGAQSRLFAAEHARRLAEADVQAQQTKIAQSESTLFGGSIKNPKELQELEADVISLKKRLTATEDQELQIMLTVETATAEVQAAQERLLSIQARVDIDHRRLIEERSGLLRNGENLLAERQAALGPVAGRAIEEYEMLRQQRRGVAVSEVLENACSACGTTLTAALQQSARHADQLVYCPSCGRILYAG